MKRPRTPPAAQEAEEAASWEGPHHGLDAASARATLLDRMPQCKEYSPSIFKPPFAKHLELGFVLFCF